MNFFRRILGSKVGGFIAVGFFAKVANEPLDPTYVATFICAGVLAAGTWRWLQAARIASAAHWLERSLDRRARYPHLDPEVTAPHARR